MAGPTMRGLAGLQSVELGLSMKRTGAGASLRDAAALGIMLARSLPTLADTAPGQAVGAAGSLSCQGRGQTEPNRRNPMESEPMKSEPMKSEPMKSEPNENRTGQIRMAEPEIEQMKWF